MSKSGDRSTDAQKLIRELLAQGIAIKMYRCDITNMFDLTENHKDYVGQSVCRFPMLIALFTFTVTQIPLSIS